MTQTVHRLRNGGGGGELPPEMSVRGRTHGSAPLEIRNDGKRLWKHFFNSTLPSLPMYVISLADETNWLRRQLPVPRLRTISTVSPLRLPIATSSHEVTETEWCYN